MRITASHTSSASAGREDMPVFGVVMAYEDFHTGQLAQQAYDSLAETLSQEWRVTNAMWKFEVLGVPELRRMAAKDAARASLIIVASHGGELPPDVTAWVDAWLGRDSEAVALIALFDCPPEAAEYAQITQAHLEGVARRGQLEFFTWPAVWPTSASRLEGGNRIQPWELGGETISAAAATALRQESLSHWGINE